MHLVRGRAEVARDMAALEAPVEHPAEALLRAQPRRDAADERRTGAAAAEGTETELGQLALEQPRRTRADRVRIPDDAAAVQREQAIAFGGDGLVIRPPEAGDALRNLARGELPA